MAAQPVQLEAKPDGRNTFEPIGPPNTTDANGSYSFPGLKPARNTTYRVTSGTVSATARVIVNEIINWNLRALPLGRMRLTVSSRHPADLKWGGKRANVFVAQGERFKLVAKPRTSQSGPTTKLTASFPVEKAGKFRFFSCFEAPNVRAMGAPDKHAFCHRHSFIQKSSKPRRKAIGTFEGSGFAPPGYPSLARVKAAARYQRGG
jgi:hypothetical protein